MYTLQGITRSTRHIFSTLDSCMVLNCASLMVHVGNFSLVPTRVKQTPTPGGSLGDRRQTGPTVVLGHLIPLPHDILGVGDRGFSQVVKQLHQLTGPITPACDRYVQYLLVGLTHWFLTDTGEGYNLKGAGFPHTTPQPS
jgi:hypothetical protein